MVWREKGIDDRNRVIGNCCLIDNKHLHQRKLGFCLLRANGLHFLRLLFTESSVMAL